MKRWGMTFEQKRQLASCTLKTCGLCGKENLCFSRFFFDCTLFKQVMPVVCPVGNCSEVENRLGCYFNFTQCSEFKKRMRENELEERLSPQLLATV
jgi:hypothetical protein